MICLKCNKTTPDTDLYCHHCGAKLDVTFDELTQKLGQEIHNERQNETEEFCRWVLVIAIFLFVSGWLFKSIWANPPQTSMTPGFLPTIQIPAAWPDASAPVITYE